eukprot:3789529-Pleurochrysis_carterae.AAC.1
MGAASTKTANHVYVSGAEGSLKVAHAQIRTRRTSRQLTHTLPAHLHPYLSPLSTHTFIKLRL